MSATRTDLWWLRLYNAPPTNVRDTLAMDRMRELGLSPQTIRPLVPQMMDAMDQHWKSYTRFVDAWISNTLTIKDWMKARRWLGREIRHYEFFPDPEIPIQPDSIVFQLMETNPNEPLTNAYTQVVSRIIRERLGLPYIRCPAPSVGTSLNHANTSSVGARRAAAIASSCNSTEPTCIAVPDQQRARF